MAKKKRSFFSTPDDVGADFSDEDFVLNYRPTIEYVEPEPEALDTAQDVEELLAEPATPTIDDMRDRTQKAVNGFKAVSQLVDVAQKRVDNRVTAAGGVSMQLDPIKDQQTIAAMKRRFPDRADPTVITYDDYKQVQDCVKQHAPDVPVVASADIKAAKADPLRTDFGGLDNVQGENRAEITSDANAVEPLDLGIFQKAAVIALFALMLPLIKAESAKDIAVHTVTAKHF